MEPTAAQYHDIERCSPTQRGNVTLDNLQVLNAILYVVEHGCKWCGLPKQSSNWHKLCTHLNRWAKNGVLDLVFTQLQQAQILRGAFEAVPLDSTIITAHPDGTGALRKESQALGQSCSGWTSKIHLVAKDAWTSMTFALLPGQAHDPPEELNTSIFVS